ncbi:hypothetical protein K504DRAFT_191584 [Pleomassaria siparia CBS 279.74]|uniref:Uncharacterized protein n=1 Tax=Pleomassaria siparia CBS 279.74 TaxID=1314801 RepID=A0A6G1KGR0_9PLEO|nr:hypothetical protein K504DRAFT_191584 [Pleomassaria siparia CBS 279.74]
MDRVVVWMGAGAWPGKRAPIRVLKVSKSPFRLSIQDGWAGNLSTHRYLLSYSDVHNTQRISNNRTDSRAGDATINFALSFGGATALVGCPFLCCCWWLLLRNEYNTTWPISGWCSRGRPRRGQAPRHANFPLA